MASCASPNLLLNLQQIWKGSTVPIAGLLHFFFLSWQIIASSALGFTMTPFFFPFLHAAYIFSHKIWRFRCKVLAYAGPEVLVVAASDLGGL